MVRPPCRPRAASRPERGCVARGSMPYSPVTQPRPEPLIHGGTRASTDAVQRTRVSPNPARTLPSAYLVKFVLKSTALIWSCARPRGRVPVLLVGLSRTIKHLLDPAR